MDNFVIDDTPNNQTSNNEVSINTTEYTPTSNIDATNTTEYTPTTNNDVDTNTTEYTTSSILSNTQNILLEGSDEFLNSNSMIARFGFIVLIIICFVILLKGLISFLSWIFMPSTNPILLDGMSNAKQMIQISQDPNVPGSIPIIRSTNEYEGLTFTWSVWINIDDLKYKENEYKHVFHKGNNNINSNGMNFPINAPGVYISKNTNDLIVVMNTFDTINEEVTIKNIPLNKWINIIIRVNEQKEMDIYINGNLSRRHIFKSIPRQNYGDVFISMNGGFSGYVSKLQYFNHSIGINKIQEIVSDGPNTNMINNNNNILSSIPDYLSFRWFFDNVNY